MDFRNFFQLSSRVLYTIAQFIVIIACMGYIDFVYYNDILPDKEVKENFVQTDCTINDKQLATKGHVVHSYRANFLVTYAANGVGYRAWVTGNGLDQAYFSDQTVQQEALDSFAVGGTYPCWYNPDTPQIVVLVLRQNWTSTLPLLIPSVVALIALYYFLRNLFILLGIISHKTKDIIKNKKKGQ